MYQSRTTCFFYLPLIVLLLFTACLSPHEKEALEPNYYYPDKELGELFYQVQVEGILSDQKTFVDCKPLESPAQIKKQFELSGKLPGFDLKTFVEQNFELPPKPQLATTEQKEDINKHLEELWDHLTREADSGVDLSTLIPLPNPYVVPGGRFREVFYWDSYFTILGLAVSGRTDLIKNMLDNFAFLIDELGYIPNGNRTYFISRSQPPFFAAMVMEYARLEGLESALKYLPHLEKEYAFWMEGGEKLFVKGQTMNRVVLLQGDVQLNHYWDDNDGPRIEAFGKEYDLARGLSSADSLLFHKNMRAACESGWDFSSRWFADGENIQTIQSTSVLPVDQNCLLYFLEQTIAQLAQQGGDNKKAEKYNRLAQKRQEAIQRYFWNSEVGFFTDYNFVTETKNSQKTLAGCFPLYFSLATQDQADKVAATIANEFLHAGGVVTTLRETGEQWDYPNGWAPLQWITIKGLQNYGHTQLAADIASRWMALNEKVFYAEGKMMEKYNVVNTSLPGGGGKYPNQDGFGWTNGIYLKLVAGGFSSKDKN